MPNIVQYIDYTSLLIHSDKPDGSTVFADVSPHAHTITAYGDIQHKNNSNGFSGTMIYGDGVGDRLGIAASDAFRIGTADFTLRCRYQPTSRLCPYPRILQFGTWAQHDELALFDRHDSEPTKFCVWSATNSGVLQLVSITSVVDGDIYDIEVSRQGTNLYLFINGTLEASRSDAGFSVNTTAEGTFWVLESGLNDGNEFANGYIGEILVLKGVAMHTEPFVPPTTPWYFGYTLYLDHTQVISTLLHKQYTQLISMSPRLYHQVTQILATARRINLVQDQISDSTTPLYLSQNQVFNNLAQVALLTTQVMHNYGASVALEMLQTWSAYDYNLVYLPMVQILGAQLEGVLTEIQFSVTVAASPVGIFDCDFNRKGFCNVATLLLRDRSEWANKQIGDPVVLTVLGEQYQMFVVNKPQDEQTAQGSYEIGYLLECASITCQLAEGLNPDIAASRVTASFPAGTLLTEILDLLTPGVCDYVLAASDFAVGEYAFDDAERYAALREVLPEQYGWVIKTDQAGVLQLSQWSRPQIGGAGQKTLTMSRKSLTPPGDTLYTQVEIRNYNQQDGTSGLRLEVVENGDGTGTIYGYSVPWTDAFSVFDSEDSSAPSLLITGGEVEEVEFEDTDVEFVDYATSLSKPCYSSPVIDWGNNDSLSPVAYTEAGTLTTATAPGYSVAVKATYTTRRKKWTFNNRKIDVSQVRLDYD